MVQTVTTAKCMNCDETGDSQTWAEAHTKDTGHGTVTTEAPVYEEPVVEEVPEVKTLEGEEIVPETPEVEAAEAATDAVEEAGDGATAVPATDG